LKSLLNENLILVHESCVSLLSERFIVPGIPVTLFSAASKRKRCPIAKVNAEKSNVYESEDEGEQEGANKERTRKTKRKQK
jgi:hypothetical protein